MHRTLAHTIGIGALLAAISCGGPTPAPQRDAAAPAGNTGGTTLGDIAALGPADVILSNGKVITVDDKFTIAQAVAIKGERVLAVGSTDEIARLAGSSTRTIDLYGRSVIPGLIDNHAHYM